MYINDIMIKLCYTDTHGMIYVPYSKRCVVCVTESSTTLKLRLNSFTSRGIGLLEGVLSDRELHFIGYSQYIHLR